MIVMRRRQRHRVHPPHPFSMSDVFRVFIASFAQLQALKVPYLMRGCIYRRTGPVRGRYGVPRPCCIVMLVSSGANFLYLQAPVPDLGAKYSPYASNIPKLQEYRGNCLTWFRILMMRNYDSSSTPQPLARYDRDGGCALLVDELPLLVIIHSMCRQRFEGAQARCIMMSRSSPNRTLQLSVSNFQSPISSFKSAGLGCIDASDMTPFPTQPSLLDTLFCRGILFVAVDVVIVKAMSRRSRGYRRGVRRCEKRAPFSSRTVNVACRSAETEVSVVVMKMWKQYREGRRRATLKILSL